MGANEQKVWAWKDELPSRGLAWYGTVPGRARLVSVAGPNGDRLSYGELAAAVNRYQRAIVELQRHLLITTAGMREQRTGWLSALVELTCRRFDVGGGQDHGIAVRQFLDTMLAAGISDRMATV
jgi:hypothetical protein